MFGGVLVKTLSDLSLWAPAHVKGALRLACIPLNPGPFWHDHGKIANKEI